MVIRILTVYDRGDELEILETAVESSGHDADVL